MTANSKPSISAGRHCSSRAPQFALTFSTFFGPFTSSCLLGIVPPSQPIPKTELEAATKPRYLSKHYKPSLPGSLEKPYLLPALLDDAHKRRAARGRGHRARPFETFIGISCLGKSCPELGVASGRRAGTSLECVHFRPWAGPSFSLWVPGLTLGRVSLGLRAYWGTSVMVVPRSASLPFFADLGKLCCKSKDEMDGTWHFGYLSCILNPELEKT